MRSLIVGLGALGAVVGSPIVAQQQKAPPAPRPITRAELTTKLDSAFSAVDSNHDGSLNTSELQAVQQKELQQLQTQARSKLQAEFNQLDTNKDGKLSLDEFVAVATVKANQTPEQLLQRYDANKDGKVSADEFKRPQMAVFDKADTNHDGTISVEEQKAARAKK